MIGGLQGIVDHVMVGHYVGYTGNAAIGVGWQIFLVVACTLGLVAGIWRRRDPVLMAVLLAVALSTAVHAIVVSQARYNLPLMPSLIAAGVAGWFMAVRRQPLGVQSDGSARPSYTARNAPPGPTATVLGTPSTTSVTDDAPARTRP